MFEPALPSSFFSCLTSLGCASLIEMSGKLGHWTQVWLRRLPRSLQLLSAGLKVFSCINSLKSGDLAAAAT